MSDNRESLKPLPGADRDVRRRMSLKHELILAFVPTAMILLVLELVQTLSQQRVLFASLASSAFLIYLDPQHGTNTIRTLVTSHLAAATLGMAAFWIFPEGYTAAATAMVLTTIFMVTFDVVHPPAVSTSLTFAFRAGQERDVALFVLAVFVIALLVILQRTMLFLVGRLTRHEAA